MTKKYKMLIDGKWVEGENYFQVCNPFNDEVLGECPVADPKHVENAILSAKKAFITTSRLSAYERSNILSKTASLLEKQKEEIAKIITLESGKAWKYAYGEVSRSIETFKFAAEETKQIHGKTVPLDASSGGQNRTAFYKPFPIGVIAAISPFNFPLNLVAHKVAPAIAAGNTIVLKPASTTPLTAIKLGEIMMEAGLPEGALNIIMGSGKSVGDLLVSHPDIAYISFTGSPAVGESIKSRCGMKKVTLELGSNSAVVIEPETNLEKVVPRCILGVFANSGQVCISVQRIYIHKNIFDKFSEAFVNEVKKIKTGDPIKEETEYGPMISEKETNRILSWISEAKANGAVCLAGGKKEGSIVTPTVLTKVNNDMKVCSDEVFAPVVSLIPYDSFEEALEMVNDSQFGLQAGIYTNNINKAYRAFNELEVGGVIINDIPTYRSDNMPYGGVKMSGIGREGLKYAISEMMELKLMVINLDK